MVKKKLTLSINKDILDQAKEQGINLSSFLEIRLSDYLNGYTEVLEGKRRLRRLDI